MTSLVRRTGVALIATLSLAGGVAFAQALPKDMKDFEKQIGLTDAQRKKMEVVDKKYQPKFKAIDGKYRPQFTALQKQMEPLQKKAFELQQKMNAEAKPVMDAMNKEKEACMSPDQVKKMKAILAKIAARNQEMMKKAQAQQKAPGK
jgi:uncharacterized protein with von Willebrand factor type A (vWA) domain